MQGFFDHVEHDFFDVEHGAATLGAILGAACPLLSELNIGWFHGQGRRTFVHTCLPKLTQLRDFHFYDIEAQDVLALPKSLQTLTLKTMSVHHDLESLIAILERVACGSLPQLKSVHVLYLHSQSTFDGEEAFERLKQALASNPHVPVQVDGYDLNNYSNDFEILQAKDFCLLQLFPSICSLHLYNFHINAAEMVSLLQLCPQLNNLSFGCCVYDDEVLEDVTLQLTQLTTLEVCCEYDVLADVGENMLALASRALDQPREHQLLVELICLVFGSDDHEGGTIYPDLGYAEDVVESLEDEWEELLRSRALSPAESSVQFKTSTDVLS